MTPIYESARATLYCGDAGDVLRDVPERSVDLLVTDPPYGQEWQSNWRGERFAQLAGDDAAGAAGVVAILRQAVARLRPRRHVYVFGPSVLADDLHLAGVTELVWDKGCMGAGDLTSPWGKQHEPITFGAAHFSKGERAAGRGQLTARMRQGSVLAVQRPSGSGVKRHPTEKPVALLRMLVESSSSLGEAVLDPFAGSGSTLIAALMEGRRALGIELDPGYCDLIVRRLRWVEQILDQLDTDGQLDAEATQLAITYL